MNSATVMSLSDIFKFCNSVGIVRPFQEPCYGVKKSHGCILAKRRDYGKHEPDFLDFPPPPLAFVGGMWYHFSVFDSGNIRGKT